jgi:hypothetical protein
MAFLNANFRLAIFHPISDPTIKPRNLELEFTKVLTYKGWHREFKRTIDGSKLHGWDAIEVVIEETKPGHVGFEHIGYDKLYYNTGVENIQDSEIVLREFDVTVMNLWSFITDFGFDSEQVFRVCPKDSKQKRDQTIRIYKYLFKFEGIVYVGWYADEGGCSNWLKAPEPMRLGIHEIFDNPLTGEPEFIEKDIDSYPIFIRIDKDDEQEKIDEKLGRGFLDGPQQEATTAITTAFVNGTSRASNICASPDTDDTDTTEMKLLDMQIIPGGIYSKPMKFLSPPYPEVSILSGLQYLGTLNAAQTGKPAFAVSNRKDARKTSEELKQAEEREQQITSTGQASDSEFLREVFSFSWLIVQSQAIQSKIQFLLVKAPGQVGETYVNNIKLIAADYDIRAAGDVDIVEADAEIQKMQQDWPVVQTVPGLKDVFLQEFIRLRYPKKADDYLAAMQQGNIAMQLVQSLSTLVKAFADPAELAALNPQQQQQLAMIGQQVEQYLASQQEVVQQ